MARRDLVLNGHVSTSDSLVVDRLTVRFGALCAVSSLAMEAAPAEITALIGPNGAGKSTVFNAITGFVPAAEGSVRLGDEELIGLRPHVISKRGVVRTFQKRSLFPRLTVFDNLRIGLHTTEPKSVFGAMLGVPRYRRAQRELHATVRELARFAGIEQELQREARTLPYGRQRMLAVAIALAARPLFLLLDEPSAGLNRTETTVMAGLLEQVRRAGVGVVLVEHDMKFLLGISHHVAVLNAGEKIADGTPAQIQADPHVRAAYLGEKAIPC